MNTFSKDRLSLFETWSESLLAHSLLVLVSFGRESGNALRPHPWTFISTLVHINADNLKEVEFWTCCVNYNRYFRSTLDRYIGKHIIFGVKKDKLQSAYLFSKCCLSDQNANLMFSNLRALKLECDDVYQKFRDCKTAGPFNAVLCLTHWSWQGVVHLVFTLQTFQRGFLIDAKIRADVQSKKFRFLGRQVIQLSLVPLMTPRVSTLWHQSLSWLFWPSKTS